MKKQLHILLALFLLSSLSFGQCFQTIAAGRQHTLALKADGTLWAWGENGLGELFDGTTTNKSIPTQVGTATNWQKISAGFDFSLAIKTDGTLWGCGFNTYGQVGIGTTTSVLTPTQIGNATNWQSVSASPGGFTAAIKSNGTLWTWGKNNYGQMGDGTTVNKNVPTQIGTGTNWQSVSTGGNHVIAIKTDGTLWAWGWNILGEVGNGTSTLNISTPVQIGTATNWAKLSAGYAFSSAIKTDGTLWTWGQNTNKELGNGNTTSSNTPIQIGTATNWQNITSGHNNRIATKTDGTLWANGLNDFGQLGNGTLVILSIPTQIGTAANWQTISSRYSHTTAIKADGSLWTWGYNANGQLGDGTLVDKTIPTAISCPASALANEVFVNNFNGAKAFPNPIKDILNISFDKEITSVSVYNLLGQEVLTKVINANEGSLDTSNLSSGTYIVKVNADNAVKTLKVIKE
jgi:alpha-tubulin suppressor-like RCC1 family protein